MSRTTEDVNCQCPKCHADVKNVYNEKSDSDETHCTECNWSKINGFGRL